MNKPYRMKAGSRKSYRKQTQHVRRYRSGRWTAVNRGVRYKKMDVYRKIPQKFEDLPHGEQTPLSPEDLTDKQNEVLDKIAKELNKELDFGLEPPHYQDIAMGLIKGTAHKKIKDAVKKDIERWNPKKN